MKKSELLLQNTQCILIQESHLEPSTVKQGTKEYKMQSFFHSLKINKTKYCYSKRDGSSHQVGWRQFLERSRLGWIKRMSYCSIVPWSHQYIYFLITLMVTQEMCVSLIFISVNKFVTEVCHPHIRGNLCRFLSRKKLDSLKFLTKDQLYF